MTKIALSSLEKPYQEWYNAQSAVGHFCQTQPKPPDFVKIITQPNETRNTWIDQTHCQLWDKPDLFHRTLHSNHPWAFGQHTDTDQYSCQCL